MRPQTINDVELLQLINVKKLSQAEAARELGVTRAAVCKRLKDLRGVQAGVVVAKKVERAVDSKLDAIEQLHRINAKANELLDEAENDPHLSLRVMNEIRGQLKLQLEIFETLFSLQAAKEFQDTILEAIGEVHPDVRREIIRRLNEKRAVRSAVKFT